MQVESSEDEAGGDTPSEGDYEKGVYYDLFEEDQLTANADQPALAPEKQLSTDDKPEGKEVIEPARTKKRINILTFKPDRLTSDRGLYAVVNEFPRIEFRGEGHEQQDLKLLMRHYEQWGNRMFPKMRFSDLLERVESFGSRKETKACLSHIRRGGRVPCSGAYVEELEGNPILETDREIGIREGLPDAIEQEQLNEEINKLGQPNIPDIDDMFEMAEFN